MCDEICIQKNLKLGETFCSDSLQQGVLKVWIPVKYFPTEWFWSSTRLAQQWGNTPELWNQVDSLALLTSWARQDAVNLRCQVQNTVLVDVILIFYVAGFFLYCVFSCFEIFFHFLWELPFNEWTWQSDVKQKCKNI